MTLHQELWVWKCDRGVTRRQPGTVAFYGLGMALYFSAQGFGNAVLSVAANGVRLMAGAGCGLIAINFFDGGSTGLFLSIASGFVVYGMLNVIALPRPKSVHWRAHHLSMQK